MKPQMNADGINVHSEQIIGCAFAVANTLGPGFIEKVYENALARELRKAWLAVTQQHGMVGGTATSSSANMPSIRQ
jgi:hypothetical protein